MEDYIDLKIVKNIFKGIAYYISLFICEVILLSILMKKLGLGKSGMIHPVEYNIENTFIMFISSLILVVAVTFIFYRKFTIPRWYYWLVFIFMIIMAIEQESLLSYFQQSTGGDNFLALFASLGTFIAYSFNMLFYFTYELGVSNYWLVIVIVFFILFDSITKILDKIRIKLTRELVRDNQNS